MSGDIASGVASGIAAVGNLIEQPIMANAQYIQNKKMAGIAEQYTKDNMALANMYDTQQVNAQEAYQSAMANSVYQRGTKDLEAAGLNPILAAGGQVDPSATGASIGVSNPAGPQPAPAQVQGPDFQGAFNIMQSAMNNSAQRAKTNAETATALARLKVYQKYGDDQAAADVLQSSTAANRNASDASFRQAITIPTVDNINQTIQNQRAQEALTNAMVYGKLMENDNFRAVGNSVLGNNVGSALRMWQSADHAAGSPSASPYTN